ncbi:MAG: hypothetical protein GF334_02910 [Candidatus Altiarchaeales archaeon]|nr:hypothetical protein [Candidatus Altiarchaeales archaeon]
MPSRFIHNNVNRFLLGDSHENVNAWMDYPAKYLGRHHRLFRHTPWTPIQAWKKFGFTGMLACIIHLTLDYGWGIITLPWRMIKGL